jgi:hypothetical protein
VDEHEHDHDGMYATELPCWRFSPWDVVGITAFTVGGILQTLGTGFGLIARECQAQANRSRSLYDQRLAERASTSSPWGPTWPA